MMCFIVADHSKRLTSIHGFRQCVRWKRKLMLRQPFNSGAVAACDMEALITCRKNDAFERYCPFVERDQSI
jgi:hypothetical protein